MLLNIADLVTCDQMWTYYWGCVAYMLHSLPFVVSLYNLPSWVNMVLAWNATFWQYVITLCLYFMIAFLKNNVRI